MEVQYEQEELYHYTSLSALMAIVNNRTIRLTDHRFLNDTEEIKDGIAKIRQVLEESKSELDYPLINEVLTNIENDTSLFLPITRDEKLQTNFIIPTMSHGAKIYILSMTDKPDDLPMWSLYGKSGCRIKFNSAALFRYFDNIRDKLFTKGLTNVMRGKAFYNENMKPRFILDTLKMSQRQGQSFMLNGYHELYSLCMRLKKQSYEYEQEYRIGVRFMDEWLESKIATKEFIEKDNCIKPQIEFKEFPVETIIENVVISPYNNMDCAVQGVIDFLEYKLHKKIPVTKSEIGIRF